MGLHDIPCQIFTSKVKDGIFNLLLQVLLTPAPFPHSYRLRGLTMTKGQVWPSVCVLINKALLEQIYAHSLLRLLSCCAEFCSSETTWPTESKFYSLAFYRRGLLISAAGSLPFHLPCLPWTKNQAKVLGWKGKEAPLSSFVVWLLLTRSVPGEFPWTS